MSHEDSDDSDDHDVMTRYRMTPPESPRDREGPSAELASAQERDRDSQNQGHVRDL